jgi:hypothetical protein
VYKDIRQVREHYAALRDFVIRNPGGRDDIACRAKVADLCQAGIAALDDAECRERLRAVERQAAELYSKSEHEKWVRKSMSGADYLRLQILIALEAVNTRLFFLGAMRDRGMLSGDAALQPPPV